MLKYRWKELEHPHLQCFTKYLRKIVRMPELLKPSMSLWNVFQEKKSQIPDILKKSPRKTFSDRI